MEISRDKSLGKMYLTQKDYLELSKFGFMDTKPVLTPLSSQFKLKGAQMRRLKTKGLTWREYLMQTW